MQAALSPGIHAAGAATPRNDDHADGAPLLVARRSSLLQRRDQPGEIRHRD